MIRKRGEVQMTTDTKPSNPKEAFGDLKMPLGLVPDTAIIEESLAFLEGALKYGQYNWRVVGVKASTYNRAINRHHKKWWNGQDRDPVTMVLELASIRACCGIMIDSIAAGNFVDDRPPRANIERTLDEAAKIAKHLKQLFKDHSPPQYTEREHGRDGMQAQRNAVHALMSVPAGTHQRVTGVLPELYAPFHEKGTRQSTPRTFKRPIATKRSARKAIAKVLKVKELPRGTRRFG